MKKIVNEDKNIAFYIKLYPLKSHANSYNKAVTIACKKSIKLLEDSFENKQFELVKCNTKVIDENVKLAEKIGISGTPTIVMPDGRLVVGYRDATSLKNLIYKKQVY
jgi:thiol:disulfide interchange protein DsbC